MVHDASTRALDDEAAALAAVAGKLSPGDLNRASPCPPWTAGQLLCHVLIGADRIRQALAEPDDPRGPLVSTADYYRPDERFSATTNADRIQTAETLAARLDGPAAIAAELRTRCQQAHDLLAAAPDGRTVRTRHGDRMLLADFAVTRVVELGVHGLDLATALGRPPWMTGPAAAVLTGLLLPGGGASRLCGLLGCDPAGLVARLTGRAALSPADSQLLADAGVVRLALG